MPDGMMMGGGLAVALSAKDQATGVFNKVGKSSQGMAATIGAAMAQINWAMLAAGAAMTIFAAISIKTAISFQEEVAKAMMMFGETSSEQFDKVAASTRKVASEFGISANEAAKAMWYMGSAGLDTASAIQILGDVTQFAKVGNLELADAASAAMTAMRVYEYEAKDVAYVTDMMFVAMRNALMTQEDFNEAMKMVAPVAKAAHLSFAEMSAVIGTFANLGIKGSMAGTSLRRGLINLMAATPRVTAALASLNVTTYDAEGNLRDVYEILGDMTRALPNVTEETANLALAHVFGVRAVAPFTGLLRRGITTLEEYAATVEEAGGLQEAWTAYSETAAIQLDILKEAFTDVARSIGMELLPTFTMLIKGIQWFMSTIVAVLGPFKTLIAYFIAIGGPLLLIKALLPILLVLFKKMIYMMTVGLVKTVLHTVIALKAQAIALWSAIVAMLGWQAATIVGIATAAAAVTAIYLMTQQVNNLADAQQESVDESMAQVEAYGIVGEAVEDLSYVTQDATFVIETVVEKYEALRGEVVKLQEPTERQIILARKLELAMWKESETLFAMADTFRMARDEIKENEKGLRVYTRLMWELEDVSSAFSISQQASRLRVMEIERRARLEGRVLRTEEIAEIELLEAGLEELRFAQAENQLEAALLRVSEEEVRRETQEWKWTIDDTTEALENQLWALNPIPEILMMINDAGDDLSEWQRDNLIQTFNLASGWTDFANVLTDVVVPALEWAAEEGITLAESLKQMEMGAPFVWRKIESWTAGKEGWTGTVRAPSRGAGGPIYSTGLHYLHKGEEVISAGGRAGGDTHISIEIGSIGSKADVDYLLDELERRLYYQRQFSGVR